MNLAQHEKNIEQSFENYESLQIRHLDMMKQEDLPLPDLKAMTLERKQSSDHLQTVLNRFMENAGSIGHNKSVSVLTRFEFRLNQIMTLDESISAAIQLHRDTLKKNLLHLKKGKQAIKGYRSAGTAPSQPRVFRISR